MKMFLNGVHVIIPCKKCKVHAKNYILKTDLDEVCKNKNNIFKFWVELHNQINILLKKPVMKVSDAWELYAQKNGIFLAFTPLTLFAFTKEFNIIANTSSFRSDNSFQRST